MDMKTIQRSYKLRCYPTREQEQYLSACFGQARWVWNRALEMKTKAWQRRKESISGVDISRHITHLKKTSRYAWLKDAPSTIHTQKLRDLDQAFANFFSGRARFPRFKKRSHAQSIRFQLDQRVVADYFRAGELLKLPRIGALRVKWSKKPEGVPKMVTLSLDAAGRYFVSFMVEEQIEVAQPRPAAVGIDLGLKSLVITSDGNAIGNPRPLRKLLKRLKHAQRVLSRRTKGSARWRRQRERLARLHARVRDARQDLLHKITTALVRDYGYLALETLNIRGMLRNRRLALSISDAAWGEFVRMLKYKAQWHGRIFRQIDPFAPSSKRCSQCGYKLDSLSLSTRHWTCPDCGTEHDRDINAATVILILSTGRSSGTDARGDWTNPEQAWHLAMAPAVTEA